MSLRLRVTLFLALAVAAAVVAVSWAAYASARHEARSEIDEALLGRFSPAGGTVVGSGVLVGSGTIQQVGPEPFPDAGVGVRPDVIMQFVDASGAVFAPFCGTVALPVDAEDLAIAATGGGPLLRDVRVDGVHYRMVTTPAGIVVTAAPGQPGELTPMALQVARDLTETDAFLAGLRTRLLLIGGSAVVLAGVLAWFVSRRAVRPVAVLTRAAEHVAATRDLEVPIEVTRRDEIGRLATSFNTMLAALASSRAQQRRLVADAGHELRTPLTSPCAPTSRCWPGPGTCRRPTAPNCWRTPAWNWRRSPTWWPNWSISPPTPRRRRRGRCVSTKSWAKQWSASAAAAGGKWSFPPRRPW